MAVSVALLLPGCRAQNQLAARYYNEGNSLFAKADFKAAIAKYEEAVQTGAADGELFYNLGTAYFQVGDLGHAILYLLRAQHLRPRDQDIRENLAKARHARKDSLPQLRKHRVQEWWNARLESLTTNEAWGLECIAFLISVGLLVARTLAPRRFASRYTKVVMWLLCLAWVGSGIIAVSKVKHELTDKLAVVTAAEVAGHNGPGEEFAVSFTIHEGMEVHLKQRQGAWQQVTLPNGWTGWVPRNALAVVNP